MTPISRSDMPPSAAATRTMVSISASGASRASRERIASLRAAAREPDRTDQTYQAASDSVPKQSRELQSRKSKTASFPRRLGIGVYQSAAAAIAGTAIYSPRNLAPRNPA